MDVSCKVNRFCFNKKLISTILCITLLNLFGCYSTRLVKPDDFVKYEDVKDKPKEIYVLTNDSLTYHFGSEGYEIKNDTLIGRGTQVINNFEKPYKGSIPFPEIESIMLTEKDTGLTTLFIIGLVAGAIAIAYFVIGVAIRSSPDADLF